jgi:peptidoglycan/xylan/chitin deacetylase (PgdA/CDA1 family)
MQNTLLINLTFDLEEFDIPEEYGQKVSHSEQMRVTREGTKRLMALLDKHGITATFFTTGNYAKQNPDLVQVLSLEHEIASHGMYHNPFYEFRESDLLESKQILEEIIGKRVTGFRMPRLKPFRKEALLDAGYHYDSSLNPTYLPGRYNLLHENPLPNIKEGLIELPCSTTPYLRFPLFWLSFKNLPIQVYGALCRFTLGRRKTLMLYFHPWEFADIQEYNLPGYVKSPDGGRLLAKLEELIVFLKKSDGAFVTSEALCKVWKFKADVSKPFQ